MHCSRPDWSRAWKAAMSYTTTLNTTAAVSRSWPNASVSANGILPKVCRQKVRRLPAESKQNRDKHQNTRTQKKEKEEYSSSFSKETTADEYLETGRLEADRQISRQYPNLDLTDAWGAFMQHHHGETRTINEWTRLWKGWCQRRANMSGIPPSKPHRHTWQCEHVLQALGRDKETATPDQRACQMAKQLNKEQ